MATPRYDWQPQEIAAVQRELRRIFERLSPLAEAQRIDSVTIGTAETLIPHNLASIPYDVKAGLPSVDARIWKSRAPDAQYVYLQASVACTVTVWVV